MCPTERERAGVNGTSSTSMVVFMSAINAQRCTLVDDLETDAGNVLDDPLRTALCEEEES